MMADMHAYVPDDPAANAGDDFADDLAGNGYPVARRGTANGLLGLARNQVFGMADGGKAELVRNIAGIVGLVRELATQVEGFGIEPMASYARRTSTMVGELHDSIAAKSVEDLVDDGRDLVRQQPEIAIAAAVIIGFLGARLVKART
jgi:hypothetical protein